jgi:hypothetical protein
VQQTLFKAGSNNVGEPGPWQPGAGEQVRFCFLAGAKEIPMKSARTITLLLVAALAGAAYAAPSLDELKKQRADAEAKLKELNTKLSAARAAIAKQDDVAALQKQVDEVRKAMEQKIASDPKVAEARKAQHDALEKARKTTDEEVAASPEFAPIDKDLKAQNEAIDDLEMQQRIAQFILGEVRRKVSKDPQLKGLADAQTAAVHAARGKAADSAEKKAAETATKAYEDAVKAKAAAHPLGAEQVKKLDEIATRLKAAMEARKAADAKLMDLRKAVTGKSEKVAAARKAAEEAAKNFHAAVATASSAEEEAVGKAHKAHGEALQARFNADPTATQIRKEIEDVNKQIRDLSTQIREAVKATQPAGK